MDPELQVSESYNYKSVLSEILNFAIDNNLRYRISFFDYYPHVRERFKDLPQTLIIEKLNQMQPELHADILLRQNFLAMLKDYITTRGAKTEIEICGEPGLPCTGCLSKKDLDIFGIELDEDPETGIQRPACACLGIKRELLDNKHPCAHGCLYCYWKSN